MEQRQIKFRAFDTVEKSMVWFDLDRIVKEEGLSLIESYKVKKVIMQFTGLLDKNGKEIWEGDIVKWTYRTNVNTTQEHNLYVTFEDGSFILQKLGNSLLTVKEILKHIEVIGNVYENPSLVSFKG